MIARNRSRAAASFRAGPRSVSMNPISAVSGVFSSWLTLATKSRRICSACSTPEVSSITTPAPGRPFSVSGVTVTTQLRSCPRAEIVTDSRCAAPARSSACSSARFTRLWRSTVTKGRSVMPSPSIAVAARLPITTRAAASTTSIGTGTASANCWSASPCIALSRSAAARRGSGLRSRGSGRPSRAALRSRRRRASAPPCQARP